MGKIEDSIIRHALKTIDENDSLPKDLREAHSCSYAVSGDNAIIVCGSPNEMQGPIRKFLRSNPAFREVLQKELDRMYKVVEY